MKSRSLLVTSLAGLAVAFAGLLPVLAQTAAPSPSVMMKVKATAAVKKAIDKADQEINRRLTSLNALSTRIQSVKRLTDSAKASLTASLKKQVDDLTALKAKIDGETDPAVLKTDIQSITVSYRIYALVIPQYSTVAAADRALTIIELATGLRDKLAQRIADAKTAGQDVKALETALADLTAKLTDADTQVQAAANGVAPLVPDEGDADKMAANAKALKDAHAQIKAANADFVAARLDALTIIKALKKFPTPSPSAMTSPSPSATPAASQ